MGETCLLSFFDIKFPFTDKVGSVFHKGRVIPGSVAGDSRLAALVIEFGVVFIAAPFFAVVGKMPVAVRSPVRIAAVAVRPLPVTFPVFVRVAEKRGYFRDVTEEPEQIIVLRRVKLTPDGFIRVCPAFINLYLHGLPYML